MDRSSRGWDPRADEAGTGDLLRATAERAIAYRAGLGDRRVGARPGLTAAELRARLGGPLPEGGEDPASVVDRLAANVDDGLVAMSSPRYFGFVVGGSVPAALAADWLVSTWDQNVFAYLSSPAASVVEEVAAAWLVELLGLPPTTSVGFTTGATMANFTALAAARHAVLRAAGWDVEEDGLIGAPPVQVVVGEHVHASMVVALRLAGFGRRRARRVAVDGEGAMRAGELRRTLAALPPGPTIVAAQAGEVNTGAFDPLDEIADAVRERPGAWLHVDGAFGLWAAASPELRHLARGIERADSWATDAHKWLNVPYDTGVVFVRDAAAHRAAMGVSAAYLPPAPGDERDPFDYVPEMSRRGRGLVVYAALRSLGRQGVAALVESNLRRGTADGRSAGPLGARGHPQRGCPQPGPCALRGLPTRRPARSSGTSRTRGRRGPVGPPGMAGWRCASRSRTGRRPRRTAIAPSTRSSMSCAASTPATTGARGPDDARRAAAPAGSDRGTGPG